MQPTTHVARVCGSCGSDRTLAGEGIAEVRDFRGNAFALIGSCCASDVTRMLNKLGGRYGAHVDEQGTLLASPRGTPAIRSIEHLRCEIGESQVVS